MALDPDTKTLAATGCKPAPHGFAQRSNEQIAFARGGCVAEPPVYIAPVYIARYAYLQAPCRIANCAAKASSQALTIYKWRKKGTAQRITLQCLMTAVISLRPNKTEYPSSPYPVWQQRAGTVPRKPRVDFVSCSTAPALASSTCTQGANVPHYLGEVGVHV
ncbi:hypothetical protein VTO73DRAFT_2423 [Trametes versicolor]